MTEPLNGLRFDIYERVNLPDDVAAVGELEEIELIPSMRALSQDDHVLLKGHLLLSGIYRAAEPDQGTARLEHTIPVEISLPPSRVTRMEDLAVEIDNFDVDLISARSLNVTGVLALRGLQAESQPLPVWHEDSFTVVHQAPADADAGLDSNRETDGGNEWRLADEWGDVTASSRKQEPSQQEYAREAEEDGADLRSEAFPGEGESQTIQKRQDETPVFPFEAHSYGRPDPDFEARPDSRTDFNFNAQPFGRSEDRIEPETSAGPESDPGDFASQAAGQTAESSRTDYEDPPQDKSEMKVAFGKSLDETAKAYSGVGLLSKLGEIGEAREAEQQSLRSAREEQEEEAQRPSRSSTGDELEWTKLFLGKSGDSQAFRKVRMCIVQRDDTLESIAARYNVQIRELQQRNRLNDVYLSEGQVLYIP